MKRLRTSFALSVLSLGLFCLNPARAHARGGFRLFRGRSVVTPAYRVQKSRVYRAPIQVGSTTTSHSRTRSANGPRIKGSHDWPGAIGFQSPRNAFFQDINGYWD